MLGLITDRTQENVDYLRSLSQKGWANMTSYERAMWTGDPVLNANAGTYQLPVNLANNREESVTGVSVIPQNTSVIVRVTEAGVYRHAVFIIGDAGDFEGKTITLAVANIVSSGESHSAGLYWYSGPDEYESVGVFLTGAGSKTYKIGENTNNRQYLALYLWANTQAQAAVGDYTRWEGLMLEMGAVRHDYTPYTPILPTAATKGAYNYSDLNRVEMVVEELSEKLGLGLTTKTDWNVWDVPTVADMSRYRDNLVTIENRLKLGNTMGDIPPDLSRFTFAHANAIENFLLEASKEVGI